MNHLFERATSAEQHADDRDSSRDGRGRQYLSRGSAEQNEQNKVTRRSHSSPGIQPCVCPKLRRLAE
jgi:hypothetical protein